MWLCILFIKLVHSLVSSLFSCAYKCTCTCTFMLFVLLSFLYLLFMNYYFSTFTHVYCTYMYFLSLVSPFFFCFSFSSFLSHSSFFSLSAGVGRTGTIIALDIAIEQLKAEGQVDVQGIVSFLRHQRRQMVQTEVSIIMTYL